MPRRCCVPGCKSNYDSTLKGCAPVSTFGFPKDPKRRELWLRAIPRKDWIPSSTSAVCVLHFEESDVIKSQKFKNMNDVVENIPLVFPKLCDDAVPRIFENLPVYLTKKNGTPRREPDCRRREFMERHNDQVKTFLSNDDITGYDVFIKEFPQHLDTQCWNWKLKDNERVYFYLLNIDDSEVDELKVVCSVMVSKDMTVKVNLKGIDIPAHDLNWALSPVMRLLKWSQFENLLVRYKNLSSSCPNFDVSYYTKKAQENLEKASNLADRDNSVGSKMLCIILDQIRLLNSQKRVYNPFTILFAFMMYSLSPTAYNFCKEHLLLPHKRYLQSLSSSLNVSPESGSASTSHYLHNISRNLIPREKVVCLLIDEIYISSQLSFKNQNIVGFAENNEEAAKTVVSFMIASPFGRFKEIVKLLPVSNISGDQLKEATIDVISFIQSFQFRVLCVITDNNRINQNMYKILSDGVSIPNPSYNCKKVYLTYDFVHIFKNIRNNWINIKNDVKKFVYPDFETGKPRSASFEHLRQFYRNEQQSLIKEAFKLNIKTLYPSNFERQNVTYVDNIFHHSTIAALKTVPEYQDTCSFLEIVKTWWDIVNSKSKFKGIAKRNQWAGPIYGTNDEKFIFLNKFIKWVIQWRSMDVKFGLSKDTSLAMERSTSVLLAMIEDSLRNVPIEYVLPGKFQTDNLEERFGLYRRLSGTNYQVSFREILESEKKLRVRKIFEMVKENQIILQEVKNLGKEVKRCSTSKISDFLPVLGSDYLDNLDFQESTMLYICGYASHSLKGATSCNLCSELLSTSKGGQANNVYFDSLQRGGLHVPSEYVKLIFSHVCAVFQGIVNYDGMENKFKKGGDQKQILSELATLSLEKNGVFSDVDSVCRCGTVVGTIFHKVVSVFANILLNNYTKYLNEQNQEKKKTHKKRKLQTLQIV